jgi:hypothetical protein
MTGIKRWTGIVLEAVVAFGAAGVLLRGSRFIDVNPIDRVGQISGLAAAQFQYALLGLALIAMAVVLERFREGTTSRELGERLVWAAVAGMTSGLVASGLAVALRGTPWPLFGRWGDAGRLQKWALAVLEDRGMPADYPPIFPRLLAAYARAMSKDVGYALKDLQLLLTAAFGPIAYLGWRLVFKPGLAVGVGLIAALPLIQPYKPYANLMLAVLLPLLIAFLRNVQHAGAVPPRRSLLCAGLLGVAFGLSFLTYAGWNLWAAPGVVIATGVAISRATRAWRAVGLALTTMATFLLTAGWQLWRMVRAAEEVQDRYFYFDVLTEPTYFAMWRDDLPGNLPMWPPPGELGGVGLFSLALFLGLGLALALGYRRTLVLAAGACLASAWMMRFAVARQMYAVQAVQLYPRTGVMILYTLLLLTTFAIALVIRALLRRLPDSPSAPDTPRMGMLVGALCACLLLFASAGSATADRYMPRNDNSAGRLAWTAHQMRTLEGPCPAYAPEGKCTEVVKLK